MIVFWKLIRRLTLVLSGLATVVGVPIIILSVLIWYYEGEEYTDGDLFRKAKECFSEEIEMADFTEEVLVYFMDTNLWNSGHRVVWPRRGSPMSEIGRILPASTYYWCPVRLGDAHALALRFGCHSNYAYLVVVNQDEIIGENTDVRCVTNNVVVVFSRELLRGL